MDNNEQKMFGVNEGSNVDPSAVSVSATNNTTNKQVIDKLNANYNNVMRGYNENLKPSVSNSLNEPINNSQQNNQDIANNNYTGTNGTQGAVNNNQRISNSNSLNTSRNRVVRRQETPNVVKASRKKGDSSGTKSRIAKATLGLAGVHGAAAEKALEGQRVKDLLGTGKSPLSKLSSIFSSEKKQKAADKASDGGGTPEGEVQGSMKPIIIAGVSIPTSVFGLTMFMTLFVVFAILNSLSMDPERVMSSSIDDIEDRFKEAKESTDPVKGAEDMSQDDIENNFSFTIISNSNSIYSIKLGKLSVLDTTANKVDKESNSIMDDGFGFDIESINSLYPAAADYSDVPYSYAFFYKMYKLNEYYKNLCGKQVLDLPLLMITLKQESEDMAEIFASNIGVREDRIIDKEYMDTTFNENVFKYTYNWDNYTYYRDSSLHDMEILAQHMVKVYGESYCKYDADGYKEFLKEFVEKKYYLSTYLGDRLTANPNSSNYFQKYDLTEDQLLQIASLCAQEQGHSRPLGAAAEASLMANKFEYDNEGFIQKYPSSIADAFYHYVRENKWWAKAAYFMDKRDASPAIVEAVKDVLINGNRTLPKYVNSHDCPNCGPKSGPLCESGKRGDICEVVTNGVTYTTATDVADRSKYISHSTKIKNVYGNSYRTFYSFPSDAGDPFSYKYPKLREKYGECHYDPEQQKFVDCIDFKDALVKWAVDIASDDSHGYSQAKRSSLIDFDCSSLVYYSLINSGFTTAQLGSKPFTTRTEQEILKKNGFTEIVVNPDGSNLQVGDILWKENHTEIYIGEGMTVGAHASSNDTAEDYQAGDQNGKEIAVVNIVKGGYWTYAYRYEH